jgi:hypothetical protein
MTKHSSIQSNPCRVSKWAQHFAKNNPRPNTRTKQRNILSPTRLPRSLHLSKETTSDILHKHTSQTTEPIRHQLHTQDLCVCSNETHLRHYTLATNGEIRPVGRYKWTGCIWESTGSNSRLWANPDHFTRIYSFDIPSMSKVKPKDINLQPGGPGNTCMSTTFVQNLPGHYTAS